MTTEIGCRWIEWACARPARGKNHFALSTASYNVLCRSVGPFERPLGPRLMEPKEAQRRMQAEFAMRQAAIITSGRVLGIVFVNRHGQLEAR
jgi:hypothetical protein